MSDDKVILPHVRLKLYIDHPSIEECYQYGYEAAAKGHEENTNPFREDTLEYAQWSEGWWAGFYGEAPLFDNAEVKQTEVIRAEQAANDSYFHLDWNHFITKMVEISGVIAVSALVGYQIFDLVA